MSSSLFSTPPTEDFAVRQACDERRITPDNPPYGFFVALVMWLLSIVALALLPAIPMVVYLISRYGTPGLSNLGELFITDKTLLLVYAAALIPTHLLMIGLAWAVVTSFGKRPFLETLGWGWGGFPLWKCAAVAVAMYAVGLTIVAVLPGEETKLAQMLDSSRAVALAIALASFLTAPFFEELYYRGIFYPATFRGIKNILTKRHTTGEFFDETQHVTIASQARMAAVILGAVMFAALHYNQYAESPGVVFVVLLLGVVLGWVRATTQSLLPCVAIHTIFNGVQAILIMLKPYVPMLNDKANQQGINLILCLIS